MRVPLLIAGALVALASTAPAAAQSAGAFMANPAFAGPPPARCDTTVAMQHCAAAELRRADAMMSREYFAARQRVGPARRRSLLAEQRQWLSDRDRGCIRRGDRYRGGTMAAVATANCWVEQTRARAVTLRAIDR